MAHRKAGGSAKNVRDSNPKYLGIKLYDGQVAQPGSIIARQRGNRYMVGENVGQGKDHTIFSLIKGVVKFTKKRKVAFTGHSKTRPVISVIPTEK